MQKFVAMDIGLGSAGSAAFIACLEEGTNLAEVRFDRLIPIEKQQAIRDTCTRLGESRSVPCALWHAWNKFSGTYLPLLFAWTYTQL